VPPDRAGTSPHRRLREQATSLCAIPTLLLIPPPVRHRAARHLHGELHPHTVTGCLSSVQPVLHRIAPRMARLSTGRRATMSTLACVTSRCGVASTQDRVGRMMTCRDMLSGLTTACGCSHWQRYARGGFRRAAAHVFGVLPYVFFLLCPVLHLLMHGRHRGTHTDHAARQPRRRRAGVFPAFGADATARGVKARKRKWREHHVADGTGILDAVLHSLWKHQHVNFSRVFMVTLMLIACGLLGTFPVFFAQCGSSLVVRVQWRRFEGESCRSSTTLISHCLPHTWGKSTPARQSPDSTHTRSMYATRIWHDGWPGSRGGFGTGRRRPGSAAAGASTTSSLVCGRRSNVIQCMRHCCKRQHATSV